MHSVLPFSSISFFEIPFPLVKVATSPNFFSSHCPSNPGNRKLGNKIGLF